MAWTERGLSTNGSDLRVMSGRLQRHPLARTRFRAVLAELRAHQWVKNLLLFAPAIAAHVTMTRALTVRFAVGFVAFSLAASMVYVINDLIDLNYDRMHPTKRTRPLASGELGIPDARLMILTLGALVLITMGMMPREFTAMLVGYVLLNLAYSLVLRQKVALDIIALAGTHVLRLFAGSALADVPLSGWFLGFFVFLLVSLALTKRVGELQHDTRSETTAPGRWYAKGDVPVLTTIGVASAMASIVVYGLYVTDDAVLVLYERPEILWGVLPLLLYWVLRIWLLVGRGEVGDDPVQFTIRDPVSYIIAAATLFLIWLASTSSVL